MRIRALLVAITAVASGGCGAADEVGAAGEEYETINAVQRETVIQEDTEAVEVTVLVEGDSIDDCLDAGLNIDLAAQLGERELIDGTTDEAVEVHPNEDASIDR